MIEGHVDHISRTEVSGWAADREHPDDTVEVVIFIDGRRRARIMCNRPRPDLGRMGVWGGGTHGFAYPLPPLGTDADHRITVRAASTGKLLGNGDVLADIILHPDNTTTLRNVVATPVVREPEHFRAPRDPREWFEAFALYNAREGLYDLLTRLELQNRKPQHAFYELFGRYPEFRAEAVEGRGEQPRDYIFDLLMSPRFQKNLLPLFLRAFPEKRRLVFIHVPKCAGTDLSVNLMERYPTLHQSLMADDWTSKDRLFEHLANLAVNLRFFDDIFLCGHLSLEYYDSRHLIRPRDRTFTVLRDPLDIAVSHVNYIMTRIDDDVRLGTIGPDSRQWLEELGMETLPANMNADALRKLCSTVLRSRNLIEQNSMCSWLGGTDAAQALARMAKNNVEVTVTANYNTWLRDVWGVDSSSRLNTSRQFLTLRTMRHEDIVYVRQLYSEDLKLYQAIFQALDETGKIALDGDDLAAIDLNKPEAAGRANGAKA